MGIRAFDISRSLMWIAFTCVSALGCSSDDDEGDDGPTVRVVDLTGRTCSIENALDVECEQPPEPTAACSGDAEACYSLGSTGDASGPAAICVGCCSGDSSVSGADDCSEITCADAGDCPSPYERCLQNRCRY